MEPVARREAWLVAGVATLAMSVSYVDRQALAVLAPTVREALSLTREQFGNLIGAFSLAYLFGAPFAGALVDRVGARRGLVGAILIWSVVAAAHAFAPTYAALLAMRIALGFAEAPSFPGATQTIRRILPAKSRSAGFGLLFTGSSIGAMIAAPLAVGIHHASRSWRLAFLGTALVGLSWLPAWVTITRRPAVRAALAVAEETLEGPPASRATLLRAPEVLRALLLVVGAAPSIMFALNWLAQYLADAYALPQDALAAYLALPPIAFDAGSIVFGALASRADRRAGEVRTHAQLVMSASVLSAAMCAVPFVRSPWLAVALAATSLAGGGALFALLTADMIARVHPAHASTAGGLTAAAQSLAYVVASPALGRVVDQTHSYRASLLVLGTMPPIAASIWALWRLPAASLGARPAPRASRLVAPEDSG